MDNLISETNTKLQGIVSNLETIKEEYEKKLEANTREMSVELEAVKKYKEEFFASKQKVEKMNNDIEGFESDYQNLVERFKDDELANILIAANKEISSKIEERKRKIIRDKKAMNELVSQAEIAKEKLVKLNAEKAALEMCLSKITDACEFYSTSVDRIITYTNNNPEFLCACFHENIKEESEKELSELEQEINNITVDEEILESEVDIIEEDDEEEVTEIILDGEDDDDIEDESFEPIEEVEEEEVTDEIRLEEDESDDDDDDKTIIMDAIVDVDETEFNISDEEIENSLNDFNDIELDINDELEEDDSLYKENKENKKNKTSKGKKDKDEKK